MDPRIEDSPSYDQLSEENDFIDPPATPQQGNFYSVFIPLDVRPKDIPLCNNVFSDKTEALKVVKKTKKARFKYFEYYHEALKFASVGVVESQNQTLEGSVKHVALSPQISERLSPFKGPKPQDLVKLRKSIETGDVDSFRAAVWENPRYLVSSGDTPSILQEGFRYNALHVSAKAKNGVIAEMILSTISNHKFITLLYGDDQNENIENRTQVLLDLYLNTPDKGLNETPLHFASKFGAADVVEVLVSFSECDKNLKNKYGQTPEMIICDRCDNKENLSTVKKKIALHLKNCFYVPVLRAEDNSIAPLIGEPFAPGKPPVVSKDPLSPRLEIHAYAGPMNKEGAVQFRKVWKTPPRTSTPKRNNDTSFESIVSLRYTDPGKGLERLGQKLANILDVNWKEYWSFLDCFVDITNEDGLNVLEDYLRNRMMSVDRSYPSSPDSPEDFSYSKKSMSTIADLCLNLQNCNLNEDSPDDSSFNAFLCVEKACNVFANRIGSELDHKSQDDFHVQVASLEMQIKQVELLVLSYLDDQRFNKVNFCQLHPRLGLLTGQKLCSFVDKEYRSEYVQCIKKLVSACVKQFDCFSSDDEGNYPKDNKPTTSKKQLICLLQNVLINFGSDTESRVELDDEQACRDAWTKTRECSCIYHFKRTRKNLGLSRNNSKQYPKAVIKTRKVLFYACDKLEGENSDEEFFTPPESPADLSESECEDDVFVDAPLLTEVFVEGPCPTRTDNALFKALKFGECVITPTDYPNIYRWYHNVNLYSDVERESWPRPKLNHSPDKFEPTTPPRHSDSNSCHTSSNSWLRITGTSSPRATRLQAKINI